MQEIIKNNISKIIKICRKYKISKLYVFGSVLNNNFTSESDIDFLYQFSKIKFVDYSDNFDNFKQELENSLQRKVDLVCEKYLSNQYFIENVNKTKILLFLKKNCMNILLVKHLDSVKKICLSHKVIALYVFGSVCTEKFSANSDIDFLVAFGRMRLCDYANNYFSLEDSLSAFC